MSAKSSAYDNFQRLQQRADQLLKAAMLFETALFGPAPAEAPEKTETSLDPSAGVFPYIFDQQQRLEATLSKAGQLLSSINKQISGEDSTAAKSYVGGTSRPAMPKADLSGVSPRDEPYLKQLLTAADLAEGSPRA